MCLILIAAFFGCTAAGTIPGIKEGKTKQEEIIAMFGQPDSKSMGSQGEEWNYRFTRSEMDAKATLNLRLIFKEDELENYDLSFSKETNHRPEGLEKTNESDGRNPRPFPSRPFLPLRPSSLEISGKESEILRLFIARYLKKAQQDALCRFLKF